MHIFFLKNSKRIIFKSKTYTIYMTRQFTINIFFLLFVRLRMKDDALKRELLELEQR